MSDAERIKHLEDLVSRLQRAVTILAQGSTQMIPVTWLSEIIELANPTEPSHDL